MSVSRKSRLLGLAATAEACAEDYGVRPVTGADLYLIGWVMDRPNIDSGVPAEAAGILARALTRDFAVAFYGDRELVHTTDATAALQMFERWPMQAQATLISPREIPPPFHTRDLDRVLAGKTVGGALAAFVPAADGDWGALYTFQNDVWSSFERALQDECALAGVSFHMLTGAEFRATKWFVNHALHTGD